MAVQRSAQSRSSNKKPGIKEKGANWRGKIYADWLSFLLCLMWLNFPFAVHILLDSAWFHFVRCYFLREDGYSALQRKP